MSEYGAFLRFGKGFLAKGSEKNPGQKNGEIA